MEGAKQAKKSQIVKEKTFSIPTHFEKKMHGYDAHETFTKIGKFMAPRSEVQALGRGHYERIVKMYYIFENLLLHSHLHLRQTKCMVMMSVKKFT